jgi:acyl-[acyl-carrier-protein]-phospholipid O-acyltransferase/long-chain-fatty-acid--[acyl-carrier-protein] ligase
MAAGKYSDTFRLPGFAAFFWTQFLGAFNDNFYKMAVSLVALNAVVSGAGGFYVDLIALLFILPSALFSGYAGQLADVYSKRRVLVSVKVFEIFVMALALIAFAAGGIDPMLAIVFLMGVHTAFFSPAKYGILPEMVPNAELSRGNGLLEMSTFVAIILGTSLSGPIYMAWKGRPAWIGVLLLAIAVIGTWTSLGIPRVPPASSAPRRLRLNPFGEIWDGVKRLYPDRTLWLTVLGISYFWFIGALVQLDTLFFGKELLALDEAHITLLGTFLAIGIGVGSLAAGRLSGDKVELGLVPAGSIAMGISLALLAFTGASYAATSTALIALGFAGGLFAVPLNALLQQRSGRDEKGRLIATNNFLNTLAIALAAGMHWLLRSALGLAPDRIALLLGAFTLAATVVVLRLVPDYFARFTLWLLTHTIYRIRIVGQEHVPLRGPALLVCNHVSFADPLLVGASVQRFIRFMMYAPYYEMRSVNWLFRLMKAIPVSARNRREIVESLRRARGELAEGHVVCIFAEGGISRTGNLLPFKRGFEKIVEGMNVPVIPVHLDRVWGSIFSFKQGRFFWKRPERIPYPVTISFGAPLPPSATAHEARRAVAELGSDAVRYRRMASETLPLRFIQTAKRHWFSFCMVDSTGRALTYGRALVASLLLARRLKEKCAGEPMIGLLFPASAGGALANLAVSIAGKTAVNLNFTAGADALEQARQRCAIKTILTSRQFLARTKLAKVEGMIDLEELLNDLKPKEKTRAAALAFMLPVRLLLRSFGDGKLRADALAAVIFSSGSTGSPKGVMLSHDNVLSNIESFAQLFGVSAEDRMLGVLPFFHSFGFTGTLWFPLISGFGAVYHSNPLDGKTIGELAEKYRATILISTPTFYAAYLRRVPREQFATLRYAVTGAEKLRESIAREFKEKYGLDLLEGYGATEMSPVISVNIPDAADGAEHQTGMKFGTVGHPLPGVAAKVVDAEGGAPLPANTEGLLLVKGPNRMIGYLGDAEKTAEVFRDGWYVTGDIAAIDDDGFIRITDRVSRFSKIAGEMVPHVKIEETVNEILGERSSVVVSVPDEQKGERLAVLYSRPDVAPDELWRALNETALPKLWIPKKETLIQVGEIPLLGSGKADLKKAQAIAAESPRTSAAE